MGLPVELALILGLPTMIIGGVWAIMRDLTRTSRATVETKNAVNTGLEELRQEMIKLRDTTTQYDMSVEKTLSDLRQRMAHMESRTQIETSTLPTSSAQPYIQPTSPDQPVEQIITLGS
jgi:chromosome segregation and condensation protein ScpB